jgi:hypothetical protein
MSDSRRVFVTEIALLMLEQWYSTWDAFNGHSHGSIRRRALSSKARGLVCHDRILAKAEVAFND